MPRNHPNLRTALRYSPDDKSWTLAVAVGGLKLSGNPQCTLYRLADIDELLHETVNCDGAQRRVKLVLKAYVKIPQKYAKKQRENRLYMRLLRGQSPTFL